MWKFLGKRGKKRKTAGKVDENVLMVVMQMVESLHPEVDLKKPIQKPRVELR